jgi:hypothetical protein
MNHAEYMAPHELSRFTRMALVVGVVALAICGIGGVMSPTQFFRSYLLGFLFCASIALGCLAIVMLQHLSGGAWGFMIRRTLECGTRTIPLVLVFFLPLLFGLRHLYPWGKHGAVSGNAGAYLDPKYFVLRAAFYFAIWLALAFLLNRWSLEQDGSGEKSIKRRFIVLSGPGLILYAFTVSFAGIDWIMSLDPPWASSIFGMIVIAGQLLAGMAFAIAIVALLAQREPLAGLLQPRHFHDLGKLLLAFTMVWAYVVFSQLLIVWAGDLPEEIPWYVERLGTNWKIVGIILVLFHFALPFLLLLSKDLKRNARLLALVAVGVLFMRWVDLVWMTVPDFHHSISLHWMDLLLPIGLGGVWLAAFFWQLQNRPLLPVGDSFLEKALEHGEE